MTNLYTELKKLYDKDDFVSLLENKLGVRFLKIRSISRSNLVRDFAGKYDKDLSITVENLLAEVFLDQKIKESEIDEYIRSIYKLERIERKAIEDEVYSQLFKLDSFNWGGFFQNAVEKTIVNNYVKKIWNYDKLVNSVEIDIAPRLTNYVTASWYNHWSSILIEDIFKDHHSILPAVGLIKKVDFFWNNFPFDLKVTYFPDGYLQTLRREMGLSPELTDLKRFARENFIHYDNSMNNNSLLRDLLKKIQEDTSQKAKDFVEKFKFIRKSILEETMNHPEKLIKWLYEEQGERRFDASNRLFLLLVDSNDFESSWKLKRNKKLLYSEIGKFLDSKSNLTPSQMKVKFNWKDEEYVTYSQIHFIVV